VLSFDRVLVLIGDWAFGLGVKGSLVHGTVVLGRVIVEEEVKSLEVVKWRQFSSGVGDRYNGCNIQNLLGNEYFHLVLNGCST
jgi:hypothetical protein